MVVLGATLRVLDLVENMTRFRITNIGSKNELIKAVCSTQELGPAVLYDIETTKTH